MEAAALIPTFSLSSFILFETLGGGVSSKVHRAMIKHTKQLVALKEITDINTSDEKNMRAVQREADLMSNLSSIPGVVKILGSFSNHSSFYIVMEYCEGNVSLKKLSFDYARTRDDGQAVFPVDEMILLTVALVDTIAALHTHKPKPIRHGDIKPANIVKVAYGGESTARYKLIDFGSAMIQDHELSISPLTRSTRNYMSPELKKSLSRGSTPSAVPLEDDIWAVGATLLNLATGFSMNYSKLSTNSANGTEEIIDEFLSFDFDVYENFDEIQTALWQSQSNVVKEVVEHCLCTAKDRKPASELQTIDSFLITKAAISATEKDLCLHYRESTQSAHLENIMEIAEIQLAQYKKQLETCTEQKRLVEAQLEDMQKQAKVASLPKTSFQQLVGSGANSGPMQICRTYDFDSSEVTMEEFTSNLCVMPDRKHVVIGRGTKLLVIDTANGAIIRSIECNHLIQRIVILSSSNVLIGISRDYKCWFELVSLVTASRIGNMSEPFSNGTGSSKFPSVTLLEDNVTFLVHIFDALVKWEVNTVTGDILCHPDKVEIPVGGIEPLLLVVPGHRLVVAIKPTYSYSNCSVWSTQGNGGLSKIVDTLEVPASNIPNAIEVTYVTAMTYVEDDLIIAGCSIGSLCVFSIASGECLKVIRGIHMFACHHIVRLSENRFVSATEQDGAVLWGLQIEDGSFSASRLLVLPIEKCGGIVLIEGGRLLTMKRKAFEIFE